MDNASLQSDVWNDVTTPPPDDMASSARDLVLKVVYIISRSSTLLQGHPRCFKVIYIISRSYTLYQGHTRHLKVVYIISRLSTSFQGHLHHLKVVYIIIGAVGVVDNLFVLIIFAMFIKITEKVYNHRTVNARLYTMKSLKIVSAPSKLKELYFLVNSNELIF